MSFHGFNWQKIFGEDETKDRNGNRPGKEAANYSGENEKKDERMNMSNPLFDISETELRDLCRYHIDSFENWSRRLLDEVFKDAYGQDYFNYMITEDQPLVKAEIKRRVEKRINDNPGRFPRKIDAIVMEDIEYFLCREDLYERHFKEILEPFFSGMSETRCVLKRLMPIRNKLLKKGTGSVIDFTLTNKDVPYAPEISIVLKTKRDWHRFHDIDDYIDIHFKNVLPPIEDTY